MKRYIPAILMFLAFKTMLAQQWIEMMQEPGRNFYEIQSAFNEYWKDKDINQKGMGYKQFKRWEDFVEQRVYPSGDLSLISTTWQNYEAFLSESQSSNSGKLNNDAAMIASTTWTAMGPFGAMSGVATNGFPRKAGRDNFITFHPTNASTYWVGAPAGGLWKTTNNGSSWTTNTDNLSVIGCSDLAVDPTNTNIMYLATGDGDAGDTYCIGVLKSIDGGLSWNPTGLTFSVSQQRQMRRLVIDPSNPQVLMAATNVGLWRTTNGGTSWTQVNTSNMYDIEFSPVGTGTVYAAGSGFYRSTNNGASFSLITNGISSSGSNRKNIAVTPVSPNTVYVLSSSNTNALQGVYRSTDGGVSFSLMASSPNLLANACNGTGTDGQGWYDLAFAASPTVSNEIVVGGVNVWRSSNGGTSWTCTGCWIGTGSPPYLKADHHELEYNSAGVLYSANDGGIFEYTGTSWTDLTAPRNIAQIYKIGLSALSPNRWITGHQDNGTNIFISGTYTASMAGDGMDCFIDRTNNNNMFACYPNGNFQKSTTGGTSWASCTSGMSGNAGWVAPWKQDPVNANTLYAGRTQMFKSTNLGASWSQSGTLTPINTSQRVIEFAIAPSNNSVVAVIHGSSGLFKSTNAGATWTTINTGLPLGSAALTNVTFDPTNANVIYVTCSGYSSGNKVFKTTNGGTSWTNISYNLPNLPANCIVYEPGTNGRVYVGMDVGVYYIDNLSLTWTLYNLGLPNTPVSDLEISPALPGRLHAATYGRGVYAVDVVPPNQPPTSSFTTNGGVCAGIPKVFTDASANSPTSWSWSVTPAAGVTVNTNASQNPTLTFASVGSYTVSMMASNGNGAGNVTTQTVTVTTQPTVSISNSVQSICSGNSTSLSASGAPGYSWSTGSTIANILISPTITTIYTVTGLNNGCASAPKTATVTVHPLPSINLTASELTVCVGHTVNIQANGANTYTWQPGNLTGSTVVTTPTNTTLYTVNGTDANGCENTATVTVATDACVGIVDIGRLPVKFFVFPNPISNQLTVQLDISESVECELELKDATGRIVMMQKLAFAKNKNQQVLNLAALSKGTYFLQLSANNGKSKAVQVIKD